MKKIIAFLLALVMTLSLCGCVIEPAATTAPTAQPSTQPTTKPVEDPSGPVDSSITITDQAGRTFTLEKPVETIVSCYYITTYATMALGLSDRLVGIEKKADSRPIYHLAAPGLLELPNVGSLKEFNVEAAAALEPDLVLMPKKLQKHADTLTELGIAVLVVDPETQENMEGMLSLIGKACGVEDRVQAILSYYADKQSFLADHKAEPPTVYMGSNSDLLQTPPGGMYQSDLISLAGGVNVAKELKGDSWTAVSYESILTWNPQVIIIPCGASYTAQDVLNDPMLADVEAVKNGCVYRMPQGIEEWDSPIPSGILGALWLHSVLHPDAYGFESFQDDAVRFYQDFYDVVIDKALITK